MALSLTRKIGERIHIGDDITIHVVRIGGQRVRLNIEAPRNVNIVRGELVTDGELPTDGLIEQRRSA